MTKHMRFKASKRDLLGATALTSALLLLVGCSAPSDSPAPADVETPPASSGGSDWEAVVEAAKEEGGVTFFNITDEVTSQNVMEAFTADTGIPAQGIRIASADLATRFAAEAEAGAVAVDVLIDANLNFIPEAIRNGWVLDPDEELLPELENYPADWNHDGAITFSIMPWGICYNTDLVSSQPEWEDLATEAFADQVIVANPEVSIAYVAQWAMLQDQFGDDFLRGVGNNLSLIAAGGPPAMEALAAGEGSVNSLCTENLARSSQEAGASVEFALPSPTTGIYQVMGIAADAPNPNAARVFANWLISAKGVAAFNEIQPSSLTVHTESDVEIVGAPGDHGDRTEEIVSLLGTR